MIWRGRESLTFWLSAEQAILSSGRSNRNGSPILRLFSNAIILEHIGGRASCRLPREVVPACQSGQSSVGWAPRQHSVHLPVCQPPATCCSRCSTSSTRPRAVEPVPSESVTNVRTKWSAAPRWRDTRWTNWHIKAKWQQHEPHHGEGTSDKNNPSD